MGKIDVVYGIILGAVSVLFFIEVLSFPVLSGGINPRVFPLVVISALFALSLVLIAQGVRKTIRGGAKADKTLPRGMTAWKLTALAAGSLAYIAVLEPVGYVLATPPLAALAMYLFGERKPVRIVLVSLLSAVTLYLVFRGVFRVPLPRSIIW